MNGPLCFKAKVWSLWCHKTVRVYSTFYRVIKWNWINQNLAEDLTWYPSSPSSPPWKDTVTEGIGGMSGSGSVHAILRAVSWVRLFSMECKGWSTLDKEKQSHGFGLSWSKLGKSDRKDMQDQEVKWFQEFTKKSLFAPLRVTGYHFDKILMQFRIRDLKLKGNSVPTFASKKLHYFQERSNRDGSLTKCNVRTLTIVCLTLSFLHKRLITVTAITFRSRNITPQWWIEKPFLMK